MYSYRGDHLTERISPLWPARKTCFYDNWHFNQLWIFVHCHSKVWGQQISSLRKLILLFSKDTLNLSNVTLKTYNMLQKISISNKCCLFVRSIYQRILKKESVSTKLLSSTIVFNIDNNKKCFLSTKLKYQNEFWRIMWHWGLEKWMLKFCISFASHYFKL